MSWPSLFARFPRRLPWECGCHDATVFGHLEPCVWRQTPPKAMQAGDYEQLIRLGIT